MKQMFGLSWLLRSTDWKASFRQTDDDQRREIEKKVTSFVAGLLQLRIREVEAESEWYFSAWPCPELVGPQHKDQCGEPTTRQHDAYGRDRGIYRVCSQGHKTPVDETARAAIEQATS